MNVKSTHKHHRKTKQGGFTLVEMMIVVVVVAIVLAFVVPAGQEILSGSRADKELNGMNMSMNNLKKRFRKEAMSDVIDNEFMISSELIADSFITDGDSTIYSEFDNGQVTVTGLDNNGLEWFESAVPVESCVDFIFGAEDFGWDTVAVDGGTPVNYRTATQSAYDGACPSDSDSVSDTVEVTFTINPAS